MEFIIIGNKFMKIAPKRHRTCCHKIMNWQCLYVNDTAYQILCYKDSLKVPFIQVLRNIFTNDLRINL